MKVFLNYGVSQKFTFVIIWTYYYTSTGFGKLYVLNQLTDLLISLIKIH